MNTVKSVLGVGGWVFSLMLIMAIVPPVDTEPKLDPYAPRRIEPYHVERIEWEAPGAFDPNNPDHIWRVYYDDLTESIRVQQQLRRENTKLRSQLQHGRSE